MMPTCLFWTAFEHLFCVLYNKEMYYSFAVLGFKWLEMVHYTHVLKWCIIHMFLHKIIHFEHKSSRVTRYTSQILESTSLPLAAKRFNSTHIKHKIGL